MPSVLISCLSFAGLVVVAGSLNPIPSRTRPLNSPAPMVLSLKTWKSRSLPGLPRTERLITINNFAELPSATKKPPRETAAAFCIERSAPCCVHWPSRSRWHKVSGNFRTRRRAGGDTHAVVRADGDFVVLRAGRDRRAGPCSDLPNTADHDRGRLSARRDQRSPRRVRSVNGSARAWANRSSSTIEPAPAAMSAPPTWRARPATATP